jgi:hypothetical protein
MSSPKQLECSYVVGALRYSDLGYLALVKDSLAAGKLDHSLFVAWDNGTWGGSDVEPAKWTTVGVTIAKVPLEQAVFLGYWGEVLCIGSGDLHEEKIHPAANESNRAVGPMRGIRSIDGKAYAVGMYRQAFRRDGANDWIRIDGGLTSVEKKTKMSSFESIDGFSSNEIYAVGRQGEIWQFDGHDWHNADSPTNMILTNICCAEDENAYVCGRFGTLLVGRNNRWQLIPQTLTEEDFWGVAWYSGKLYLSTMRFIYVLENGQLIPVDFGEDVPLTCFHLSAANGVLWSIGAKDLMAFDGVSWTRLD